MALEAQDDDKPENEPLVAPSLPPPSKAVQRVRRGKVSVDIWASTEEVEYERRANQIDLEADDIGAVAPKERSKNKKKKKPPLEIYYLDRSGQVQGPYPKAQMQSWFVAGFFPPTTMVKTNRNDTWVPVGELPALQPEPKSSDSVNRKVDVADDERDNSIMGRISALKKEASVEERIAALKQQNQVSDDPSDEQQSAIQDRIAALRAAQRLDTDDGTSVPPPPPPQAPSRQELVHEYPVEEDNSPYLTKGNNNLSPPPSYPLDEDDEDVSGIAPYPTSDEPPPYPVDDDDDNEAYPVDDSYPIGATYPLLGDDSGEVAYPVTDSYPVIDEYPETGDGENQYDYPAPSVQDDNAPVYPMPPPPSQRDQQKKIVKVDKEVVAFMPSNLYHRKKRKATSQDATKPKKVKQVGSTPQLAKDDYDKFMEEIEGIGEE